MNMYKALKHKETLKCFECCVCESTKVQST